MEAWFSITPHDIKNGVVSDANSCPVARAINRILKPEYEVSIYEEFYISRIYNHKTSYSGYTPENVFDFIQRFDNESYVAPERFCIDIPEEYLSIDGERF